MTRLLLFVTFMVLTAGAAYWLLQEDAVQGPSLAEELGDEPLNRMQFETVALEQQDAGRVTLRLWSEEAIYYEQRDVLYLAGVRFEMHPTPKPGQAVVPVQGVSRNGLLNQTTKRIILTGQVELHRGDALELRTERLEFEQEEETLLAPEAVWIRQGDSVQQGRDMVYSLPDEKLTLRQPMLFQ